MNNSQQVEYSRLNQIQENLNKQHRHQHHLVLLADRVTADRLNVLLLLILRRHAGSDEDSPTRKEANPAQVESDRSRQDRSLTADGKVLVTTKHWPNGTIKFWRVADGRLLHTYFNTGVLCLDVARNGLTTVPGEAVAVPGLALARVRLEARVHALLDLPEAHTTLVVARVLRFRVEEGVLDARGLVDLAALDPLGRLGGEDYCRVTGVRSIPRA